MKSLIAGMTIAGFALGANAFACGEKDDMAMAEKKKATQSGQELTKEEAKEQANKGKLAEDYRGPVRG